MGTQGTNFTCPCFVYERDEKGAWAPLAVGSTCTQRVGQSAPGIRFTAGKGGGWEESIISLAGCVWRIFTMPAPWQRIVDSGQFLARRRNAVLLIDEKFLAFRTLNSQPTETLKYIYWCDDKILRKGVHRVHLTKKNMYTRYHVIIQLFSFVIFSVNYFSKINC